MKFGDFSASIPQGRETYDGYVVMMHGTVYTLVLSSSFAERCDAEVEIDGKTVGVWRVPPRGRITLERPVNDTGCFTFYKFGSEEGRDAGLVASDKLGLVSVTFKPEKPRECGSIRFRLSLDPGGTGLSGESEQRFVKADTIHPDKEKFVRIHLRLVCEKADRSPRPLASLSSPVPPSLPINGDSATEKRVDGKDTPRLRKQPNESLYQDRFKERWEKQIEKRAAANLNFSHLGEREKACEILQSEDPVEQVSRLVAHDRHNFKAAISRADTKSEVIACPISVLCATATVNGLLHLAQCCAEPNGIIAFFGVIFMMMAFLASFSVSRNYIRAEVIHTDRHNFASGGLDKQWRDEQIREFNDKLDLNGFPAWLKWTVLASVAFGSYTWMAWPALP